MFSEKSLTSWVLVTPIIHLLNCFLFLVGYSVGFGAGIAMMFSVSDIFSLSLTDMVVVYVGGFIIPVFMSADKFRPDYVSPEQRPVIEGSRDALNLINQRKSKARKMIFWGMLAAAFLVGFQLLLAVTYDYRLPFPEMMLFAVAGITATWYRYAAKLRTSQSFDTFVAILLALFASSLIIGMSRGQGERRYSPAAFAGRITCGNYTVLRSGTDKFLAVQASGHRVILDRECKPLLRIPYRPPFEAVSYFDLTKRLFGADAPAPAPKPAKIVAK